MELWAGKVLLNNRDWVTYWRTSSWYHLILVWLKLRILFLLLQHLHGIALHLLSNWINSPLIPFLSLYVSIQQQVTVPRKFFCRLLRYNIIINISSRLSCQPKSTVKNIYVNPCQHANFRCKSHTIKNIVSISAVEDSSVGLTGKCLFFGDCCWC